MRVPGPGIWSFHSNILDNPALYFYSLMQEYGDVIRCRSVHDIYLISHPQFARDIFQQQAKHLTKEDEVNTRLRRVIGDGVVVTSGDIWRVQRHRAQVTFQKKEIQKYTPIVENHAVDFALKLSAGINSPVILQEQISQHILSILLKCLFNEQDTIIKSKLHKAFASGYEYVANASFINLPDWLPFTKNHKLLNTARLIDLTLNDMQITHQKTNRYDGTLLEHLMNFKKEDGSFLTPQEVTVEAKNILAAGHFSTTDLLCWMIYSLALYPEWQQKIRDELAARGHGTDFQNVPSMQYFIHEVMRCYPPAWSSWHKTKLDIQIKDFVIPANKTIIISFFNIHRNPNCWNNPDDFDPLRFANGLVKQDIFMPFGFGQRKCVGMGLANLIITQTISNLVCFVNLKIDSSRPIPKIQSRVTLGSKDPIHLLVSPL
ncbi:cytochrome P450 [Aquiflexum sp.]|uniref:cytochrome P450 n=1 Tax=Aquiflexum sp. TaxID=1872584 RepID=UPI0035937C70